jgi:hypothetical protein
MSWHFHVTYLEMLHLSVNGERLHFQIQSYECKQMYWPDKQWTGRFPICAIEISMLHLIKGNLIIITSVLYNTFCSWVILWYHLHGYGNCHISLADSIIHLMPACDCLLVDSALQGNSKLQVCSAFTVMGRLFRGYSECCQPPRQT